MQVSHPRFLLRRKKPKGVIAKQLSPCLYAVLFCSYLQKYRLNRQKNQNNDILFLIEKKQVKENFHLFSFLTKINNLGFVRDLVLFSAVRHGAATNNCVAQKSYFRCVAFVSDSQPFWYVPMPVYSIRLPQFSIG